MSLTSANMTWYFFSCFFYILLFHLVLFYILEDLRLTGCLVDTTLDRSRKGFITMFATFFVVKGYRFSSLRTDSRHKAIMRGHERILHHMVVVSFFNFSRT